MIARLTYIVSFLLIVKIGLGNGNLDIQSEEDLYRFYEDWSKSNDIEIFREKQRQYTMQLMNSSVDPCEDFFEFACGNFGSILPENSSWKKPSSLKLLHYSQVHLQQKLLEDEVDPLEEEIYQKVKIFYRSCMDNSTRRIDDLANFVKNFAAWPILQETVPSGEFDWMNVTARAAQYEVFALFGIFLRGPSRKIQPTFLNTNDDGLDLESFKEKAAYLSIDLTGKDSDLREIENFVTKVTNLQKERGLLGMSEEIELKELPKKTPEIDLRRFLQIYHGVKRVPLNETVILIEPIYFEDLSDILSETDPKVIANYVFTRFVEKAAYILDRITMFGINEWCIHTVEDTMNAAFARLYSRTYFDEEAHAQIKAMVNELQDQGRRIINGSEWITPETKVKALEKINGVKKNVGLPDHYRNISFLTDMYKDIEIDRNNFFYSYFNAQRAKNQIPEMAEEILSQQFLTDPLTVNAFFAPLEKGVLEIPAAVLQPPVFHKYSAKYVNYGGIGAAIGHEFMHGFDDQFILFDENGDLGIWWDPRISSTYYTRAGCFSRQYGQYKVGRINKTIDGETTLGENVSDNEGLKLALNAYKRWLEDNEETSNIEYNGELLSPVQSFYLAFAQNYCSALTQEELEEQIEKDVHSPGVIRVIGTLSNSPDFAEAYKCPVGSKMNPKQKCKYLRK